MERRKGGEGGEGRPCFSWHVRTREELPGRLAATLAAWLLRLQLLPAVLGHPMEAPHHEGGQREEKVGRSAGNQRTLASFDVYQLFTTFRKRQKVTGSLMPNRKFKRFFGFCSVLAFLPSDLRRAAGREAARKRRRLESDMFGDLCRLLPLHPSVRQSLDKPSVIRLSLSFIRAHALLKGSVHVHACTALLWTGRNAAVTVTVQIF